MPKTVQQIIKVFVDLRYVSSSEGGLHDRQFPLKIGDVLTNSSRPTGRSRECLRLAGIACRFDISIIKLLRDCAHPLIAPRVLARLFVIEAQISA